MEQFTQFEGAILLFLQDHIRQEWMDPFWKALSFFANGGWGWIAITILLLCFRKTRKAGIAAAFALIIGALITNVALKNLVARTRPYEVIDGLKCIIERQVDYSFPSGHSCASFAAAFAYFKTLPKKYGITALVVAALIAFSRLYVGVHFPTDVIGGILIGLFSGWAACKIVHYYESKKAQNAGSV